MNYYTELNKLRLAEYTLTSDCLKADRELRLSATESLVAVERKAHDTGRS